MQDALSETSEKTSESQGFKIGPLIDVLRKRKWIILAIVLTVPTIVAFFTSKQPNVYEASTSIVIDLSVPQYLGAGFKDVVEIESSWWTARETLETEFRVIRSFSTALAVAEALCQKKIGTPPVPALQKLSPGISCDDKAAINRIVPSIQGAIQVMPVKDSRIVNLSVTAGDPDAAAAFANTLAQVYTNRNLERRLSASEGAATWLGDEYTDLTSQLNEAERSLIDFKKKNNILAVAVEDDQNEMSSMRKKLYDEINTLDIKLVGMRVQREQYQQMKSNDPLTQIAPGAFDNPVMLKLKELYLDQYGKLLEMRGRYLEKHPAVIAQEARVNSIREDLSREANMALKAVETIYQSTVKQDKELRAKFDSVTKQAIALEKNATEYKQLKREYDRLTKLSEQVGGRERETSLATHLKTNNVRILDAALVPKAAISPNVPRAVGMAFIASLLLAIGLAFLLDFLDATVKTQDDIERVIGLSFLGLIPTISPDDARPSDPLPPAAVADLVKQGSRDLYVLAHPKSSVAECCRAIRTNLLFMSPDKPLRSLLVTSAGPQEGKTTTAVNLAITLAQSGLRVLIVDTDMRRPRLHKAFGIPSTSDGLSKAIVGECQVLDVVRDTGIPNLHLLPCGATPPNPAELLHADAFKRIAQEMIDHYDRVIFDSPPIGAVTDAAILARLTHGTILVAKGGYTNKEALARAKRHMSGEGVNILGCILNDLDLTKPGSYGYYYYSRYGYYYREDEDKPEGKGKDAKASAS